MIIDFVLSLNFLPLESELWMRKNITWICLKNEMGKLTTQNGVRVKNENSRKKISHSAFHVAYKKKRNPNQNIL